MDSSYAAVAPTPGSVATLKVLRSRFAGLPNCAFAIAKSQRCRAWPAFFPPRVIPPPVQYQVPAPSWVIVGSIMLSAFRAQVRQVQAAASGNGLQASQIEQREMPFGQPAACVDVVDIS